MIERQLYSISSRPWVNNALPKISEEWKRPRFLACKRSKKDHASENAELVISSYRYFFSLHSISFHQLHSDTNNLELISISITTTHFFPRHSAPAKKDNVIVSSQQLSWRQIKNVFQTTLVMQYWLTSSIRYLSPFITSWFSSTFTIPFKEYLLLSYKKREQRVSD